MFIPLRDNAPTYEWPWVNLGLIATCLLVFAWQVTYPGGLHLSIETWGEVPTRILAGENVPGTNMPAWVTLFTSMWMHAGPGHLLGNMYALWLFGDNIEWACGRVKYLLFYIATGVLANVVTTLIGFQSDMPGVGASGAIFGVMAAYMVLFPHGRITFFVMFGYYSFWTRYGYMGLRNFSALWVVGMYLAFEVLYVGYALSGRTWLNLGVYAHVGGALVGMGLVMLLRSKARMAQVASRYREAAPGGMDDLFGEEGDAGGGYVPVANLQQELERVRGLAEKRRTRHPDASFRDYRVEELLSAGQLHAAEEHCREMQFLAQRGGDRYAELGYHDYLRDIQERYRQHQVEAVPREEYRDDDYARRVERVKARIRRHHRREIDWL